MSMTKFQLQHLRMLFSHRYARSVVFRDVARCDGFALFEATRNPEFNRHLLWPAPAEEGAIFVQIDKLIREHTLGNALILSLCDRKTGTWLGLARIQAWSDGVEFGLYMHPDTWSKWAPVTAGDAILQVLLDEFPDLPVYIRMRGENERMKRFVDYGHFEPEPQCEAIHAVEGPILLDVYRHRRGSKTPYPHLSTY